jgi:hypothetical protein
MKIYACFLFGAEGNKYSAIECAEGSYRPWLKKFHDSSANRGAESFLEIATQNPISISLSRYARYRKRHLPDLTTFVQSGTVVVSERFYNMISPLLPSFVEWIPIGILKKELYYLMNFTYYPNIFNFEKSNYNTFGESAKSIVDYIWTDESFEDARKNMDRDVKFPFMFQGIQKIVYNREEVTKCPLFILPYSNFGNQSIYFTDQIMEIIESKQLRIDGEISISQSESS